MDPNGEKAVNSSHDDGPKSKDLDSIFGNMALAHEMILNDDFKLATLPDNTLEKVVRDVVHKAFWDHLQEQLSQETPCYSHALNLLEEIKETMLSLMLPQNVALKSQVEEVLDMELIKQEVDHGCFDLKECARFIIIIMSKLCAPVRDEEVKKLQEVDGIVPILRGILGFLDMMKLDMANFQMQKLKPILVQQSVEYERSKFQQFLELYPEGTTFTKEWLRTALREVRHLIARSQQKQEGKMMDAKIRPLPNISPSLVLTHAYLMLLDWSVDERGAYPETTMMDQLRLIELSHMFSRLCLIGSVMLMTSNIVGQHLATDAAYIKRLKDQLFVLVDAVENRDVVSVLPNLCEQVIAETKKACEEKELKYLTDEQESVLRKQISTVLKDQNSVHNLIKSRIRDHVLLCMTSERAPKHNEAPLALTHVQDELKMLAGRFARLIAHNRNVYNPFYAEIIESLLNEPQDEDTGRNEVCNGSQVSNGNKVSNGNEVINGNEVANKNEDKN